MSPASQISASDRERFVALLEPVTPGLWRTAQRLTRERHAAEDLLQSATLKALRFFSTWQEGSNFKAWMFRVLYTTHLNTQRDCDPRTAPLFEVAEPSAALAVDAARPTHAERIALVLESVDDEIRKAVDALPEHLRLVFLLSTVEDLKYREIADVLECPIGTVMSRLFRARELLQDQLVAHARERGWKAESIEERPA